MPADYEKFPWEDTFKYHNRHLDSGKQGTVKAYSYQSISWKTENTT